LSAIPKLEQLAASRSQLTTESLDILPGTQESSISPLATNPAADLLLNPIEEKAISSTPKLLPVFPPKFEALSGEKEKPESTFLTTSLQTQEELSRQLAQMATQLRRNAEHFTEALAQDRAVMEGAEEKLEGNLTRIGTERSRLKVHSGKSGSTTWLVLGAILVVVIAWIIMFLVIRVT
jgi:Membrane fusion protein Use1